MISRKEHGTVAEKRVTRLDNEYTRVVDQQSQFQREERKRVHIRRASIILGLFLVIMIALGIQLWSTHRQISKVDNQIRSAKVTLQKKQTQNKELTQKQKLLKDPTYLQELLRSKYNYAKKGEIIYNFVK
ncbi:MAG TPA: septum formation initiator family protein [Candidatus Limosilactobacillus faecipullorum]|nr:septum formation initiator family protein [Candidatus Limosilactobacillus faecipullorum]